MDGEIGRVGVDSGVWTDSGKTREEKLREIHQEMERIFRKRQGYERRVSDCDGELRRLENCRHEVLIRSDEAHEELVMGYRRRWAAYQAERDEKLRNRDWNAEQ